MYSQDGEGNGTPLQYSCLENPMDGGTWQAAVHGVAESWTGLSGFTFTFSLSCIGEGNGNPLQCSCLENPRSRRAWWADVYGVAQSRTQLKRLSSSSSSSILKKDKNDTRIYPLFRLSCLAFFQSKNNLVLSRSLLINYIFYLGP